MKFYFDKRVMIGFSITMVVLVILGVFSYNTTQRLIDTASLQSHATRVMSNAEQLIKAIVDMETGQRGFVITGNEEFLEPYHEASQRIDGYVDTLDSLTLNNTLQQSRLDTVRQMINEQMLWNRTLVEIRRKSFEEAQAAIASGEGKRNTDAIRVVIRQLQDQEMDLLKKGNVVSGQVLQEYQYSFSGLCLIVILIVIYLFYTINASLKARNEAETELHRVANETKDLYDNAPCGYHSLDASGTFVDINQTELRWLGYSHNEVIGKLNFRDLLTQQGQTVFKNSFQEFKETGVVHDLEFDLIRKDGSTFPVILNSAAITNEDGNYVKSRSTVMDNTERKKSQTRILDLNQELEGFTYSVSHDLRAPLRSIIGYANILKEEQYDKMDVEGKRITEVIIRNTIRMGQLIDDLLDFSRLGRKQVIFSTINMKETVESIVREQTAEIKDRKLAIKILELEPVKGDLSMIRQVWINLISNALKYASKKEITQIEIGSFNKETKKVYYISDNGAGFDMKYGDKLFGVFQRLHKMNEFEGTGVGLALVKTIIKRHGGDVWAEGKINEGAKFYFSLN
jgi:PAS domain S-box-containing protein